MRCLRRRVPDAVYLPHPWGRTACVPAGHKSMQSCPSPFMPFIPCGHSSQWRFASLFKFIPDKFVNLCFGSILYLNLKLKSVSIFDERHFLILNLVGARGFEPPTTATPLQCATRLRYAPLFLPKEIQFISLQRTRESFPLALI